MRHLRRMSCGIAQELFHSPDRAIDLHGRHHAFLDQAMRCNRGEAAVKEIENPVVHACKTDSQFIYSIAQIVSFSTGLYGFGMSLNDIIDRRRDRLLAAHRPLPSGRIGVNAAHLICSMLILLALLAGAAYSQLSGQGWISMLLVIWTAMLIVFYDLAAKYLVALGLLSLGLIRFFHAVIPAPQLPLVWHPLLLLNHVTLVSL